MSFLYEQQRTGQTWWRSPGACCAVLIDFKCRVQSRELEGRSCHVSLFAREPSSLQRSTTLSPCTLFSPYSGPAPDDHNAAADGCAHLLPPIVFVLRWNPRPPSCCFSHTSTFLLNLVGAPLKTRTTLTSWRTPWTCRPSSGSWTRDSTKSRGSTSRTSGWCSTTPGCTTARPPASTSTAPSWLRCSRRRLTPSCRALDTVVGGRWDRNVFSDLINSVQVMKYVEYSLQWSSVIELIYDQAQALKDQFKIQIVFCFRKRYCSSDSGYFLPLDKQPIDWSWSFSSNLCCLNMNVTTIPALISCHTSSGRVRSSDTI